MGPWCVTLLMNPLPAPGEEESAVDPELLEFLGSWGGEDEAWAEFLAAAEIRRASRPQDAEPAQPKQVEQ